MNDKKNKTLMIILGIFALVIVTTAASFAYFTYSRTSETKTTITTGDLQFSYFERKNSLDIVDQYPLSDKIGAKDEANAYEFQVGMTSTSDEQKMNYDVILVTNNTGSNTFTNDQIKYNISRDGTYLVGDGETGVKLSTINGLNAGTSTGEGIALKYQPINSGEVHNYKLRMWISDDVSYTGTIDEETGTMTGKYNANTYSLKVRINASQEPAGKSFATDSWEEIAAAVKSGNYVYKVGDTKTITLAAHTNDCSSKTGDGADYVCNSSEEPEKQLTVRVANTSACTNGETSETACGFVVEFVGAIEKHNFNNADTTYMYGSNIGGWRDSKLRSYITPVENLENSGTIFKALPDVLQRVIIDTKVVSGHGLSDVENNFKTVDKLYLLSSKEIYGFKYEYDTVDIETRQLDYYKNKKVSISNSKEVVKEYNGNNTWWWLRSAYSNYNHTFLYLNSDAQYSNSRASEPLGISPAFRIG